MEHARPGDRDGRCAIDELSAKPETHDDRNGRAATGTPRRLRPSATRWLLAIPVFVGAGLLLFGTGRLGLGVSRDSVIYLQAETPPGGVSGVSA